MAATVPCPVLGDIPSQDCQDWRKRSRQFVPSNAQRVTMFRACRRCPRNAREEDRHEAEL
jgi:hypothetical protein